MDLTSIVHVEPELPKLSVDQLRAVLEANAPQFLSAVTSAQDHGTPILLLVSTFHTQPALLVAALRYAALAGVIVQFMPTTEGKAENLAA